MYYNLRVFKYANLWKGFAKMITSVGKRIFLKRKRPSKEVLDGFRGIPASNVSDVMNRSGAMHPRIHLVSTPTQTILSGVALTVKCPAGDNLAIHVALHMCGEDDVLVISNDGGDNKALVGEVMVAYLKYGRRAAGIVIDGPIRDIHEIRTWDFPVYCTGTTPCGPYKEGPGEVNVPICCGGLNVNPGDVILADPDGVIVIPRNDADVILKAAKDFQKADEKKARDAKKGILASEWIDKALVEKGFIIIDDVYHQ